MTLESLVWLPVARAITETEFLLVAYTVSVVGLTENPTTLERARILRTSLLVAPLMTEME